MKAPDVQMTSTGALVKILSAKSFVGSSLFITSTNNAVRKIVSRFLCASFTTIEIANRQNEVQYLIALASQRIRLLDVF
jgi:hypothetical protein